MKILSYGIPAAVIRCVAARYGFRPADSFDDEGGNEDLLLTVRAPESAPGLLALYDTLLAREAEIDAVVVCSTGSCATCATIRYATPQGKFYTLGGDADDEALAYELGRIVETLSGRLCVHEGI